jgi:hypothetical protein
MSYMRADGDVAEIEGVEVAAYLEERWLDRARLNRDYMPGPYAELFPGVAPAAEPIGEANPFSVFRARAWAGPPEHGPYRLLLIACRRAADAIMWTPNTITLGVTAPPSSHDDARKLAGEIYAAYPPGDALGRDLDDQAWALVDSPHARYDDIGRAPGVWSISGD